MFCDQLLPDFDSPRDGFAQENEESEAEASLGESELHIENLILSENSPHIEFEQRLRDFERRLESEYKSRKKILAISKQVSAFGKMISARKQRLEAACCHGIQSGSKVLLGIVLKLCWRKAYSEFYASKALSLREGVVMGSQDSLTNPSDFQVFFGMSVQDVKEIVESVDDLQAKLGEEETKRMSLEVESETLQLKLNELTLEYDKINPSESILDRMSGEELEHLIETLDAKVKLLQSRKASLEVDQRYKCVVCWSRKKEVAFRCGHQTCSSCADRISNCPICRQTIDMKIRLF